MPKCPKCGKEIDQLIYEGCERMSATVELNSVGTVQYFNFYSHGFEGCKFKCPECGEVLFKYEDDAEKFLRGEMKDGNRETA